MPNQVKYNYRKYEFLNIFIGKFNRKDMKFAS